MNFDWMQIVNLLAPVIAAALVQGIKKLCNKSGWFAIGLVIVVGGIAALIGIGPNPGADWADKLVNAGFISGLASLIYSIMKPKVSA